MAEREIPEGLAAFDPLEDLYTEAQLFAASKRKRKQGDPALRDALDGEARRMKEVFTKPENWERTRGVALIHRDSNTLLGNYSEYVHRFVKGSRKLIHEFAPISISGTEFVSGYWWLADRRMTVDASTKWNVTREAFVDIQLPELGVAYPNAEVLVGLYLGGIMRVELAQDTQFASPEGRTLLLLPKGTNLLECMSTDSKIALRQELGL